MSDHLSIRFAPLGAAPEAVAAVLCGGDLALPARAKQLNTQSAESITRAAAAADFKGRKRQTLEVLAPQKIDVQRIVVVGLGASSELNEADWVNLGGLVHAQLSARKAATASLIAEWPVEDKGGELKRDAAQIVADLAFGALLRSYAFKKYRTKRREDDEGKAEAGAGEGSAPERDGLATLVVQCADPRAAETAFLARQAVADGTFIARDLVNEPANMLGPVEFAARAAELAKIGVEITVLEPERLAELKMNTLLCVAQGSARPARVVVMQWNGAKKAKPVCFIGKGVCFDTGGISMKPAAGMEDMKGDMGGAACVTGLMHALAARKARVNAVGIIGLVENMPSGTAIRPGDIVTSMSGQTVEILNTDAEGRLVLCDLITYAQQEFKPRLMVDLATLTGAIMVALGKEYAGLFSNDDKLSKQLFDCGEIVGEKVWRMPLGKAYDKLIDSKNADMKNIGGRFGGSITAAQFLQRFVKGTPWAHLDIAGTAMDSGKTDTNQSWGSGWGVRLLDRMVADHYEG
jgi:leucyl aminopeptidase